MVIAIALIAAVLPGAAQPSSAIPPPKRITVTLDGDPWPIQTDIVFEATCSGGNKISIKTTRAGSRTVRLTDLLINGRSYRGTPKYVELERDFAARLSPVVTSGRCLAGSISINMDGRWQSGSSAFFTASFPLPK